MTEAEAKACALEIYITMGDCSVRKCMFDAYVQAHSRIEEYYKSFLGSITSVRGFYGKGFSVVSDEDGLPISCWCDVDGGSWWIFDQSEASE